MTDVTRRAVLAAGAGIGVAASGLLGADGSLSRGLGATRRAPRIVIVGAGLAGLACADLLHRNGWRADIYEARPNRIGGRCWSSRGWRHGQVAEHGGEFIDSRHRRMLALADRFGLRLDDTYDGAGGRPRLFLQGRRRHLRQFDDVLREFDRRIERLAARIGPYNHRHWSRHARDLDEMTALEVVDQYLPGGSSSTAGRWYHCYLASYLGLDLRDLGGLAVIDDRASHTRGADERYHVHGGNDQIVHCLADSLPRRSITLDAPLRAVVRRSSGTFDLRFGGVGAPVRADAVVLCLPFTALRDVDLDGAGLSVRKRRCIDELGMGTNAKVIMQFAERPQEYGRWNGYIDVDRPFVETWESSAGQAGATGLITAYFGGRSGAAWLPHRIAHGAAPRSTADSVLDALARHGRTDLRGLRRGYLGRAVLDHWVRDPWTKGSYAAYLPGQYTRFAGFVGKPEGNLYFAGEHTSPLANQGYLEGAVRTGQRAAREVLAAYR